MEHMIAQIASQYLPALLEYQCSDDPLLNDKSSPQYYFSTAMCLLNFLTTNPDVCIRIAKHPTILHDTVEKLLAPDLEAAMQACDRSVRGPFPPGSFEADFGSLLQFLSTILLYPDHLETLHPRIKELIPKLKIWKKKYKSSQIKTISNASSRLITQIQGMDRRLIAQMRDLQATSVVCGYETCGKSKDLTACAACKIQRYCGKEHQKKDWKYHKQICNKGLEGVAE